MNEFDEECLNVFLENQSQLFEEAVAETLEDAEAFLEDCMAAVSYTHLIPRLMRLRSQLSQQDFTM